MTLTLGTNFGFVTSAPTADPGGEGTWQVDDNEHVTKDTSSSTAAKITEVGWWANEATEAANFEVGLYAANGGTVQGEAGTLLEVSRTNAKGTGLGWKVVTGLNWEISSSTNYWIAVQLDDTATLTIIDIESSGGPGYSRIAPGLTTLPNDWTSTFNDTNGMRSIYAVIEVSVGFTRKIKISGTFQDKPIKTKVSGTFEDKPIKIKVGGTFQDA